MPDAAPGSGDRSHKRRARSAQKSRILLTGATGYIGGRLAPLLVAAGHPVRCLVRDAARLRDRSWAAQVEIVEGDLFAPATLPAALQGVATAYYLVHAMAAGAGFRARDLQAARAFGRAAADAGVARIVYLGGLGDPRGGGLSQHLRSRHEVGGELAASGVPVTEFRAAVVVGAGSLGFEMIRYLTERLPVMVCPRWVYTRVQPIAVDDALAYLVGALDLPPGAGVIEIGGADVLTYGGMMTGYAARARPAPPPRGGAGAHAGPASSTGCTSSRPSPATSRGP